METTLFLPVIDPPLDPTPPDLAYCAASAQWNTIGTNDHHGICLPLFSLRSASSAGIGEYPDLIPLIKWGSQLGLSTFQLLPLNDTGLDTSPYNSLTANALSPLFIGLSSLEDFDSTSELKQAYKQLQHLNALDRVDYLKVREGKERFLQLYFKIKQKQIQDTVEYRNFEETHDWLEDFAKFKTLKEENQWSEWKTWDRSISPNPERVHFHKLCQYLCFQQLVEVKKVASEHRVLLKGDIPILISKESSDVWKNPELFFLDFSAGAPPDMYSKEGQYWGFPIYNWAEMKKQNDHWWKSRLQTATSLYHLYRIDHIVGFFRIWTIPNGMKAMDGHFVPVNQSKWVLHGETIMKMMLENSTMLPIGEDLGVVPNRVRNCLTNLGICGTKVMRWERRWDTDASYIMPESYPRLSMTTVSTHDSETLQQWWIKQPAEVKEFASAYGLEYTPLLTRETQQKILWQSHHSNSIFHINLLQEYLTLFNELSWEDPEEERINVPGTISDNNWTYRFKPMLEEIVAHNGLKEAIKKAIQ